MEEVEEASSIVIQRLLSKIDMFDLTKSPTPFIYRAMKNHSIDEFRKKNNRRRAETAAAKSKNYTTYIEEDTSFLIRMYKEDLLSGTDMEIFTLVFQDGKSKEEAAELCGIPLSRCRKIITGIKKKFKKVLYAT